MHGKLIKLIIALSVLTGVASAAPQTWFVRNDGGTRYSANVLTGQCNGKFDAAYPGAGVNQNCAFNDFRYMWDDDSGAVGAGVWVIAGGDTVVIRGCKANVNQANPSNPNCRIGWDVGTGGGATNLWCQFVGSYTCYNPPIPAGTAGAHTKILGACAYGTYSCNPVNHYPYTSNLTQIFGGFSLSWTFNLSATQYVDVEGIELTTHNGVCVRGGSPAYPRGCASSIPLDDYAQNGFLTDNTSANILFQDVYVHGFNAAGLYGPIGGPITATRMFVGFNGFAGWTFDDTGHTPDAVGSSINASYVTMEGNGCYEQYPIVNTQFPAQACYDSTSNGFGDGWSGQDTALSSFTCDHCVLLYNTKDGFIGPHTQITSLTITNSFAAGNMGAQWKWASSLDSTVLFQNNLTVTNCIRMAETLPGAAHNFNQSSGLGGAYLTSYCRAGGAGFATITRNGSTNNYTGNTVIGASNIIFQYGCGYYSAGNVFNQETNCTGVPNVYRDNNFLGYNDPSIGASAALYYATDAYTFTTASYNNEFALKAGTTDTCGVNHITCVDPLLYNQPSQTWVNEAALDVFNPFTTNNSFYPTASSPLIGAGIAIGGLTTDYYATARSNPPWMGGVNSLTAGLPTASTPTFSPVAGTYVGSQSVVISASTGGVKCYNTTGAPATNGTTGCTTGTLYTAPVTVPSSQTIYAVAGGTGYLDSAVASAAYVITVPTTADPACSPVAGTYAGTQSVTCTSSTPASTTYCTIDGTTPTTGSPVCTTIAVAASLTLKAISARASYTNSNVISNPYVIGAPTGVHITITGSMTMPGATLR